MTSSSDESSDSDYDWMMESDAEEEEFGDIQPEKVSKIGRPSYSSRYPELVPCIKSFIAQNTPAAHLRRRNDVMYLNGVTLKDIVSHVRRNLGLVISRSTIHNLMTPPRRKTLNSSR